jgi:hypothetical protein
MMMTKTRQQPVYDIATLVWTNIPRSPQARKERKKVKRIRNAWIRVWNNHTKFTDKEIWEIVRFVTDKIRWRYHCGIEVRIEVPADPGDTSHGKLYWYSMDDPIITAYITDDDRHFPTWAYYEKGGGYIDKFILDRTEALVMVLAHEFRHLWQSDIAERKLEYRRRGYVWGARGIMSDRDADAFAIHKVRQFRRQRL